MEAHAGQRLHHTLENTERELRRNEFENHGAIAELPPNSAQCLCEHPTVVKTHRGAVYPRTSAFRNGTRLEEQLVSLQATLDVPSRLTSTEEQGDPFTARPARSIARCQPRSQGRDPGFNSGVAAILPGKKLIEVAPCGASGDRSLGDEAEVGDGQRPRRCLPSPTGISECVQLLHIAEFDTRGLSHPASQRSLQRPVGPRVERTSGEQGRGRTNGQNARPIIGDRDHHCGQTRLHAQSVIHHASPREM